MGRAMKNILLSLVVSVLCSTCPTAAGHANPTSSYDLLDVLDFDYAAPNVGSSDNKYASADDLRRYRNKLAAKKCRQKRKERVSGLADKVDALSAENAALRRQNQELLAAVEQMQANRGPISDHADVPAQVCMR